VPAGTGAVYVASSLPNLGPWRADGVAMKGKGRDRVATITAPPGTAIEYKFTLGTWEREALTAAGTVPPNHRLVLTKDTVVTHEVAGFKKEQREYIADWRGSGVKGRLVYWTDVSSAFLGPKRNVEIWLPPGYDEHPGMRYPVLYMHDGQNLFDPRIANTGVDWGVDEAVTRLVSQGVMPPIIVVGVWSTSARSSEYSPWHDAPKYARFLIEELMPRVNREFRTRTGPSNTAVMGSSMGGLLSFYLVTHHPDVFGACGCESTHFPLSEAVAARVLNLPASGTPDTTPFVIRDIRAGLKAPRGVRYRFDYGTLSLDSAYGPSHAAIRQWLLSQGRLEGKDFVIRRYEGATHNEASWRGRLGDMLTFLYGRKAAPVNTSVPAWSKDAIWYQIFVERFRNGDPSNDPTAHDIEGVTDEAPPQDWRTTPWTHDWYQPDPWARGAGKDFYGAVQFRRYGGDLAGVLERLDYLQQLGVTALYLNPVNDAPSLHKYDARNYAHIDRNFGPDPRGDEARMAAEDPADPSTWRWTSADSLFLVLVREVHRRGMRIIMDYSWNHTGIMFWAWRDVVRNQRRSRFADWYEIERFDDPATPDTNEFRYRGWAGVPWLPEWKKVGRPAGQTSGPIEGNLMPGVREHVFDVTRRWLDPNADGDPADGVDGFRLDVADVVPLGFWRDYRRFVRSINPDAYLVGEVWWEHWPDKLWDAVPWLRGDVFDAIMNYRWYTPTRSFFAGAPPALTASRYAAVLDSLAADIDASHLAALMNLTASHDTPRFGTSIYNRDQYKYKNNPRENPKYRIDRPDDRTRTIQRQILVQQFTYVGAPHIWNGDEVGMWGADDPDERKPIVWPDLRYEDEVAGPLGRPRRRDRVEPDTALFRIYQEVIALRKTHQRLFADGALHWLVTDDKRGVLMYDRVLGPERAVVVFNVSDAVQEVTVPGDGSYRTVYPTGAGAPVVEGSFKTRLAARSSVVWIRE
jgi:glycosidase/enterochelin esterase-like enzyme